MKSSRLQSLLPLSFTLLVVCGLWWAAPATAQSADVVTVGTITARGPVISVPVYVRDVSGTPCDSALDFTQRMSDERCRGDEHFRSRAEHARVGIQRGGTGADLFEQRNEHRFCSLVLDGPSDSLGVIAECEASVHTLHSKIAAKGRVLPAAATLQRLRSLARLEDLFGTK